MAWLKVSYFLKLILTLWNIVQKNISRFHEPFAEEKMILIQMEKKRLKLRRKCSINITMLLTYNIFHIKLKDMPMQKCAILTNY
jgi:hypothetical protein